MRTRDVCPACGDDNAYVGDDGRTYSKVISIEYAYGHPDRYDGASELLYPCCGTRIGRWTGNVLKDGESEPRYGREREAS